MKATDNADDLRVVVLLVDHRNLWKACEIHVIVGTLEAYRWSALKRYFRSMLSSTFLPQKGSA